MSQTSSSLAAFTRAGIADFGNRGKKRLTEGGKGSGIVGHTTDKLKRAEKAANRATNAADDRPSPKNESRMQKARQEYAKAAQDHVDAIKSELDRVKAEYAAKYGKQKESAITVFSESDAAKPSRFKVILIKEGMGNLADRYYYPAEVLQESAHLFEGSKIFSDHESESESENRPERSIEDIRGHFENVKAVVGEDGRTFLEAEVVIPSGNAFDMARDLMRHSVEYSKKYPDKNFIGLSINAGGRSEEREISEIDAPQGAQAKLAEAQKQGIMKVKYVTALTVADSCDLVTRPGAGGEVVKMLEGAKKKGGDPKTSSQGKQKETDMQVDTGKKEAGGHDDADQDAALIKKMLKDHLNKDEPTDDETASATEAYAEAKSIFGDQKEAAIKCAAHFLKKGVAAKEAAAKEAGAVDDKGEKKDDVAATEKKEADKKDAVEEGKKESDKKVEGDSVKLREAEATTLKQAGEIASLKARIRKIELQEHVDKKLKESKLPNSATKVFREKMGEIRSEKELDEKLSLFVEAWSAGGTPSTELLVEAERTNPAAGGESETDLSTCTK